jgi:hypothetical protein
MSTQNTTTTPDRKPYRGAYRDEPEDQVNQTDPNAANTQAADATQDDKEATTPEEKSYKKRYGDLRTHAQKMEKELKAEIKKLSDKLSAPADYKPPSDPNKLREWMEQFPEVAKNIETIADERAVKRVETLQKKLEEIEARNEEIMVEKAEIEILRRHPDYSDLRNEDDFHDWAEQQHPSVQAWIYENKTDAELMSRAIQLYKDDRGIKDKDKAKKGRKENGAAEAVITSSRIEDPTAPKGRTFKLSEIARMKPPEFERLEKEIDLAQKEGRIIADM